MTDANARPTREFGSSHALAWWLLPTALAFLLFGLSVLVVVSGTDLHGWALAGIGGGLLAVIAVRMAKPPVSAIVLSPEGLVFRDVSSKLIPWREIRAVEMGDVSIEGGLLSRRVASIAVSRAFFATLTSKGLWPCEVVSIGEPTMIHLAYHRRDVPVDELAELIEQRRRLGSSIEA